MSALSDQARWNWSRGRCGPEHFDPDGKISAISPGADVSPTDGTAILNLRGYSVMPGIVGMHNHLFYLARPNISGPTEASTARPFFIR